MHFETVGPLSCLGFERGLIDENGTTRRYVAKVDLEISLHELLPNLIRIYNNPNNDEIFDTVWKFSLA